MAEAERRWSVLRREIERRQGEVGRREALRRLGNEAEAGVVAPGATGGRTRARGPDLDPDLPTEEPRGEPVDPTAPGCWWYRDFYADDAPAVEPECGSVREVQEVEWKCCLTRGHADAVRSLNTIRPSWRDEILRAWTRSDGNYLDATADADALAANLASSTVEPLWRSWESVDTGYTPAAFPWPRAEVMTRALWLIAALQEGIPSRLDGLSVRGQILGPINAGTMSYRVYETTPGGTSAFVRKYNCHGPARQIFVGGPSALDDPTSFCDVQTPCATASKWYDMRSAPTFTWRYEDEDGNELAENVDAGSGNNHAWPKTSDVVWLCRLRVDRAAVMYDWYWGQIACHLLEAMEAPTTPLVQGHLSAILVNLRMAMSVAAELAVVVLHETGHNINLYHCDNPAGSKGNCVQDIAAYTWWVYAAARLGLTWCGHTFNRDAPFVSKVIWGAGMGRSDRQVNLPVQSEGGRPIGISQVATVPGWYLPGFLECEQGDAGMEETMETMEEATDLVVATAALAGWLLGATWGGPVVVAGLVARALEEGFEALATLPPSDFADLAFALDQPLVPGGVVLSCCIYGRPATCSDAARTPCWPEETPVGYRNCCRPEVEGVWGALTDLENVGPAAELGA